MVKIISENVERIFIGDCKNMIRIEDDKDIFQYVKTVKLSTKVIPLLFRVHKGFDSLEELKDYLELKKIEYKNVAVIRFLNMYYAVAFEDYNREFMIGKNNYFYSNDKYMLIQGKTPNFKPKFFPAFLHKKEYKHLQLYYDLEEIDSDIDIFKEDVSIKEHRYSKSYAIILGLTFFSSYIKKDELPILNQYFSDNYIYIFRENPTVLGINPFKSKILYTNGKKVNYQFFNRTDKQQYWAYRHYGLGKYY